MNSSINTVNYINVETEKVIKAKRENSKITKSETKDTENKEFNKTLDLKIKEAEVNKTLINTTKNVKDNNVINEKSENENITKTNKSVAKETQSKNNEIKNIICEIENLEGQNFNLLSEAKRISSIYNVPRSYVVNALSGNGKFYEDANGILTYQEEINKLNIGTQRTYIWKEDGTKQIMLSSSTGSSIMQLDDEDMKKLLEKIDKINENFHEMIEAEKEKEMEEEMIEEIKAKKIVREEIVKSKEINE